MVLINLRPQGSGVFFFNLTTMKDSSSLSGQDSLWRTVLESTDLISRLKKYYFHNFCLKAINLTWFNISFQFLLLLRFFNLSLNLKKINSCSPDFELPVETEEIDPNYLKKLSEYFLELLIFIYCERYETYLSAIEPSEKLEREVVHFLCSLEPMAFSFLSTKIYRDLEHYTNDLDLTNVLNKVATVKNSDCKNLKSIYELKQEFVHVYSPYFYHYSTNEKSQSDEKLAKLKKSNPEYFIKPSNRLPMWQPAFRNIRHLLDSDMFLKIVHCVLTRVIRGDSNGENKLLKVLYLIGLALHEDLNDLIEFKTTKAFTFSFVEKCERMFPESGGLKRLLESIITMPYLLSEAYKSSAEWTLNYYLKLSELKSNKSDLTNFTVSWKLPISDIKEIYRV